MIFQLEDIDLSGSVPVVDVAKNPKVKHVTGNSRLGIYFDKYVELQDGSWAWDGHSRHCTCQWCQAFRIVGV